MARQGVWQLQKLLINYCDYGGSSAGARQFIQSWLPHLRQENPQIEIEDVLRRGHHPFLLATYRNGKQRSVVIRNEQPEEILRQAVYLRSCTGRKASLQTKQRTQTLSDSIQGTWTPQLQDVMK